MIASSGQNLQDTDSSPKRLELSEYFLLRLKNMVSTRAQVPAKTEQWKIKALDRAIYSTMLDCEELDVKEDAKEILKGKGS